MFECVIIVGALSSYQSRTQVDYQFGMHLKEERKLIPSITIKPPSSSQASPASESTSWSKNTTADLLF